MHNFLNFLIYLKGGSLFSQQQNDDLIELSVHAEGVTFIARTGGKTYEHKIMKNLLNNQWHTVYLQYRLGNLTLDVNGDVQVKIEEFFRIVIFDKMVFLFVPIINEFHFFS